MKLDNINSHPQALPLPPLHCGGRRAERGALLAPASAGGPRLENPEPKRETPTLDYHNLLLRTGISATGIIGTLQNIVFRMY